MRFALLLALCLAATKSFAQWPYSASEKDYEAYKSFAKEYNVEGSTILHNPIDSVYLIFGTIDHEQPEQLYTPASTFKIFNSLVGLETGVIPDENFVLKWDGVDRKNQNWNKDQDLKTAFKNSTVWYYQELAKRVGGTRMKYWLDTVKYGNADTIGGIDKFWLSGNLRITSYMQLDFLKRLHDFDLPFSKRNMEIVQRIMLNEETPDYKIYSKTGWGFQSGQSIGWYVGWIETKDKLYYFVTCITDDDENNPNFGKSRIEITKRLLHQLSIINN